MKSLRCTKREVKPKWTRKPSRLSLHPHKAKRKLIKTGPFSKYRWLYFRELQGGKIVEQGFMTKPPGWPSTKFMYRKKITIHPGGTKLRGRLTGAREVATVKKGKPAKTRGLSKSKTRSRPTKTKSAKKPKKSKMSEAAKKAWKKRRK